MRAAGVSSRCWRIITGAAFLLKTGGHGRSCMERSTTTMVRIGAWCVNPGSGKISRDGETARVEVRTMRVLVCLAEHAGEVVSIDDLLDRVWSDVTVAPDSVYQAVTSLRRVLGDDPKEPTYIETVPRLGYRMVATVCPWADGEHPTLAATDAPATDAPNAPKKSRSGLGAGLMWTAGAAFCFALAVGFAFHGK